MFGLKVNGLVINLLNEDASATQSSSPAPELSENFINRRRFTCQFCQKGFNSLSHLQRHERIHSGDKPFSCPIENCPSRFSRHDNMMQHYRTHAQRLKKRERYLSKKKEQKSAEHSMSLLTSELISEKRVHF
jgi:uncharacterized Zn-finger protein